MDLYVFADPPISAGFRNRLRLAMILPGKAVVGKLLTRMLTKFKMNTAFCLIDCRGISHTP